MEKWQIIEIDTGECHAGTKAPRDINAIADAMGFKRLVIIHAVFKSRILQVLNELWCRWCYFWLLRKLLLRKVDAGSVVFVQYPSIMFRGRLNVKFIAELRSIRKAKIVTLIHDVEQLRGLETPEADGLSDWLRLAISVSDVLIVHNASMKKWFVDNGFFQEDKLIELGIFDYLMEDIGEFKRSKPKLNSVIIAGNLSTEKGSYLTKIGSVEGVLWHLYGPYFNPERICGKNIAYGGCFPPEQLVYKLDGAYGLVWDGEDIDTCIGNYGKYLKYNNPHKLSLYIACGIPVIIWSESAEAEFVKKNGLGICVDSLNDISKYISKITDEEYFVMKQRVYDFSKRLRAGEFLKNALLNSLEVLK